MTFPDVREAIADWFPICAVEAALAHEATYPARRDEYGPVLAAALDAGRALDARAYEHARRRRIAFTHQVSALLATIDLLLVPFICSRRRRSPRCARSAISPRA